MTWGKYGMFDIDTMTEEIAKRIQQLRKKRDTPIGQMCATWRRTAEIICEEFPDFADQDLYGNQLYGIELCEAAAKKLGISDEEYEKDWL